MRWTVVLGASRTTSESRMGCMQARTAIRCLDSRREGASSWSRTRVPGLPIRRNRRSGMALRSGPLDPLLRRTKLPSMLPLLRSISPMPSMRLGLNPETQ